MLKLRLIAQGKSSHALWQAWALMEAEQGDVTAVRYLFKKGIEASPRSRYLYLAWGLWEKKQARYPPCTASCTRLEHRWWSTLQCFCAAFCAWA